MHTVARSFVSGRGLKHKALDATGPENLVARSFVSGRGLKHKALDATGPENLRRSLIRERAWIETSGLLTKHAA